MLNKPLHDLPHDVFLNLMITLQGSSRYLMMTWVWLGNFPSSTHIYLGTHIPSIIIIILPSFLLFFHSFFVRLFPIGFPRSPYFLFVFLFHKYISSYNYDLSPASFMYNHKLLDIETVQAASSPAFSYLDALHSLARLKQITLLISFSLSYPSTLTNLLRINTSGQLVNDQKTHTLYHIQRCLAHSYQK